MRKRGSLFQYTNFSLLLLYMILVIMGVLNIYAATYTETGAFPSYAKQITWVGLSLIMGLFIMVIDVKFYESFAYHIFWIVMLSLLAVLVVGTVHKGARSWFSLGIVNIQPTEFAKFATALGISKYVSDIRTKYFSKKNYIELLLMILLPMVLISFQPDLGSAVVFLCFYFALYREGFPGWVMLVGLLALVFFLLTVYLQTITVPFGNLIEVKGTYLLIFLIIALAFFLARYVQKKRIKINRALILVGVIPVICYILFVNFAFNELLEQRHRDRVNNLIGLNTDISGSGYNVHQSKIAIGSGGFFGKGYLQGTQTKYNFVPEQRTDFIFCTIGEEWGFVGSVVVILLFLLLFYLLILAAEKQKSRFSRCYGYCVLSILFFHFAINVGMTIGLVPVIGIPLPFFSYGGSSLWGFTLLFFIFLKLDSEQKFMLR